MTTPLNLTIPGTAHVINGNANNLPLADWSVDLIVTSPPYFALRDYKDTDGSLAGQIGAEPTPADFLEALWTCAAEWWRVLAPGGSLWVNLGDKYNSAASGQQSGSLDGGDAAKRTNGRGKAASGHRSKSLLGLPWRYAIGMIDGKGDPNGTGWILRAEVIWAKPNGLPESVKDRVRRSHEQWFHFTKSERYYSSVDAIREPHKSKPGREGAGALGGQKSLRPVGPNSGTYNALGALPGSVWTIATEPLKVPADLGIDHFAAFPTEWPRRIILGWAPTKGVCLTCGEGLRPVVEKSGDSTWAERQGKGDAASATTGNSGLNHSGSHRQEAGQSTITNWACACDAPGPTRPAVVLDPFGGTGTTAAVAKALGCVGISNDLSKAYCKLATWRTNGDGYEKVRVKVLREKPKPKPAPEQPTLLDT